MARDEIIIRHERAVFAPRALVAARDYLDARFRDNGPTTDNARERQAVARGEGSDRIRLDPRWYDLWRDPSPGLLAAIGPHVWVIFPPQVRRMEGADQQVPWHQDLAYQRLLGARGHEQLITCFVPLEDEPSRHATVEFADTNPKELEHAPLNGFGAGLTETVAAPGYHFELELGDALVFSELALHRTALPAGTSTRRRSLEFRLIDPRFAVEAKDYFDVTRGEFVRMSDGRIGTVADPLAPPTDRE